ncbi:MAG TPA: nickel pincer cofactor biosynthesis protein LarC [Acidimicrobiales bacterium]|nr:nickel pincer cofactor biosynthesis protein LarC [Acidimicrobiales bacterium]
MSRAKPAGVDGAQPSSSTEGSTVAWFHCFSGIAGDMALGSLIDAGADFNELLRLLDRLPIGGWALDAEPVLRGGIAATKAVVHTKGDGVVRTFTHILGVLEEARLPDRVRERSIRTFSKLAEVEGRLHRRPPSQVHFHEVGGHDTIIDIVGTAAGLELLDVETVTASAVATGTGVVRTSHGILPNPAPAVVRLLEGIPVHGRDVNVELTTPTGAAILAGMATSFGSLPPVVVTSTGFGAGSRDLDDMPNCTQVVIGTATHGKAGDSGPASGQPLVVLEANLDDATGETLAHAVETLLEAGALDTWIAPVVMKKGRPGHVVTVLTDTAMVETLRAVLAAETGSLGVRRTSVERWPTTRQMDEVTVAELPVRVKVSPGRVKIEHADAARVAKRTGMPLREVVSRAEAAWREKNEPERRAPEPDPDPPEAG